MRYQLQQEGNQIIWYDCLSCIIFDLQWDILQTIVDDFYERIRVLYIYLYLNWFNSLWRIDDQISQHLVKLVVVNNRVYCLHLIFFLDLLLLLTLKESIHAYYNMQVIKYFVTLLINLVFTLILIRPLHDWFEYPLDLPHTLLDVFIALESVKVL